MISLRGSKTTRYAAAAARRVCRFVFAEARRQWRGRVRVSRLHIRGLDRERERRRVGWQCGGAARLDGVYEARVGALRGGGGRKEEEEELAKGGKEKRARVGEVERRSGDGSVAATACSVSLPRRSGRPVTPSLT